MRLKIMRYADSLKVIPLLLKCQINLNFKQNNMHDKPTIENWVTPEHGRMVRILSLHEMDGHLLADYAPRILTHVFKTSDSGMFLPVNWPDCPLSYFNFWPGYKWEYAEQNDKQISATYLITNTERELIIKALNTVDLYLKAMSWPEENEFVRTDRAKFSELKTSLENRNK